MKEITITVNEAEKKKKQGDLFGIFFEDLNHAADGGLYGELLRNRAFEFCETDKKGYHAMTAWETVQRGDSTIQVHAEQRDPRNQKNPHYLVLEVLTEGEGAGIRNEGYAPGVPIEEGKEYLVTCYCRLRRGSGSFWVLLEDESGETCYASQEFFAVQGEWRKLEGRLKAGGTDHSARLAVLMKEPGELELDLVSLFPEDTFRKRRNGLRRDIAELLEALKPHFLRFPGGCLTHIGSLCAEDRNAMYRWKNTLGEVWDRPAKRNSWDYNQTLGLGFYEFFLFCEDIGAKPLPVISAGYDPHYLRAADLEHMQEWIDEALDLIEFANGGVETTWGAIRAEMGHPERFGLKYLGIGNEEVGEAFYPRYEKILKAVKEVYPDIEVINSAGPGSGGSEFIKGWDQARRTETSYVDEHFYQCPEWFAANAHRYETYDPEPKAFLGEYASQDTAWWNALTEAAFMIGMEKSPGLGLACYAPLLNNVNYTNWQTTLLCHDNHRVYGTPSYYIQKLFMNEMGEELAESEASGDVEIKRVRLSLQGGVRIVTDAEETEIRKLCIRNDRTGEEIRIEDFVLSEEQKEKALADLSWEEYTISFGYCRNSGGTADLLAGKRSTRLEFARRDEKNGLQLVLDGWQRMVSLAGMVRGKSCDMGLYQFITERGTEYPCHVTVKQNQVCVQVGDSVCFEHCCKDSQPDAIYHSAVTDAKGNLIVKLANLEPEKKHIRIRVGGQYTSVEKNAMEHCGRDWKNSFEEPEKVAPVKTVFPMEGREFDYEMPGDAFAVLKFIR